MRLGLAAVIGLATTIGLGGSALAQAAPDTKDLQCLVVSFLAGSQQSQEAKTAGALSAFYFLGKLDGRAPGVDLEKPIVEMIQNTAPKDYEAMAKRCGAELQERGKSVTQLGDNLSKIGAK